MSEERNGWASRETWALSLWLDNDQGIYEMARERVADALKQAVNVRPDTLDDRAARIAGEAIHELWDEITDPDEGLMSVADILAMVRHVGSEWRIDWDEIGASYVDELVSEEMK